jgi:organic radical activating enzyme
MKLIKPTTLTYPIVETFHSVQGEGMWTGTSAFFIRLGGCDVHCPWCDQKESWSAKGYPQHSVLELAQQAEVAHPAMVVITGGEPLMHDLSELTQHLRARRLRVHLETSGAHPFSGCFDWVTLSPKPFKLPHASIYDRADELKVVIAQPEDLEWAEQQAARVPGGVVKYLQPEWNAPESQSLVVEYVLQHPQWRVSLQTHKFLGVR